MQWAASGMWHAPQCGPGNLYSYSPLLIAPAAAMFPPCVVPLLQEHGGDVSAGYAEMGSEGGSKGGEARKEQLAEVGTLRVSGVYAQQAVK